MVISSFTQWTVSIIRDEHGTIFVPSFYVSRIILLYQMIADSYIFMPGTWQTLTLQKGAKFCQLRVQFSAGQHHTHGQTRAGPPAQERAGFIEKEKKVEHPPAMHMLLGIAVIESLTQNFVFIPASFQGLAGRSNVQHPTSNEGILSILWNLRSTEFIHFRRFKF